MTSFDYAVLIFYFVYMVAISWIFRRFVTNVSDYFRGGGKALWWMVGGSAFMVQFSAWTFTGAASKAYADGWPIAVIYLGNAVGFMLNALHFAPKFRQLRVVTGVEAIRIRFGKVSEQFFTWLQLPFGLLQAGIWLNSLAVFFAAVFDLDLSLTIVVTGLVVLVMALLGGSWAVLASDFIQVLILMPVCLAVTVLAVLKLGGPAEFLAQVPARHLDFSQVFSYDFLGLWCVAMLLKQIHTTNNLADANRYLCVKDGQHARWAGFLGAGLFVAGIVIWFLPPIAAAIRFPDLHAVFPHLRNPEEAAFIAISRDVMPVGMMGLLVSGIFAATMSSMDSGLNKNTGFFIKNFYQPIIAPHAPDSQDHHPRVRPADHLCRNRNEPAEGPHALPTHATAEHFDRHPDYRTALPRAADQAHPPVVRLEYGRGRLPQFALHHESPHARVGRRILPRRPSAQRSRR